MNDHEVVVCGGGPAGLTAALWLARYRRKVLVVDAGAQRNRATAATHGVFTRDGASPQELLDAGKRDLERYQTVDHIDGRVEAIRRSGDLFLVEGEHDSWRARLVILATGVEDVLPDVPGLRELYGTSVFHCTSCDGYEARDRDVLAIGWHEHSAGFVLELLEWARSVRLVTHGEPFQGDDPDVRALKRHGVDLIEEQIEALEASDGELVAARLSSGRSVPAQMAFFSIAHRPRSRLAAELGCRLDEEGRVEVDRCGRTNVDGVYAIGDVTPGEQLVQVAAAQGAIAAIDCAKRLKGTRPLGGAPPPGPDPAEEL